MANTINASFGLNISPLKASATRAIGISKEMAAAIRKDLGAGLKYAAGGFAALGTAALGASIVGVKGVIALGDQLSKLGAQTGIAVGSLATLQTLANDSSTDFDGLAGSVNKMQRNLFAAAGGGSSPVVAALGAIGLNAEKLAGLKPEEQFREIGTRIAALPSSLARSAEAMAIFGKSGAQLIPLFDMLGTEDFGKLGARAEALQKNAALFKSVTISFRQAEENFQSGFIGIAAAVSPVLKAAADFFSRTNALAWGDQIGKAIKDSINVMIGAWKKPQLAVSLMKDTLIYGFLTAGDVLTGTLSAAGVFFKNGFLNTIQSIGDILLGTLMEAFRKPVAFFQASLQAGVIKAMANLPTFLGGTGQRADTKNQIDAIDKRSAAIMARNTVVTMNRVAPGAMGQPVLVGFAQGMSPGDQKQLDRLAKQRASLVAGLNGPSVGDLMNQILASGGPQVMTAQGLKTGRQLIEAGKSGLKESFSIGAADAKSAVNAALAADPFGAQAYAGKLSTQLKVLEDTGEQVAKRFDPKIIAAPLIDRWAKFKGWGTFGGPQLTDWTYGVQGADGLQGASLAGLNTAYNPTPLLSHREMMGYLDKAVAEGANRPGSTSGAYNSVHSGDRRRAREFERSQLRQAEGVEKTNALLDSINAKIDGLIGN